MMKMLFWRLLIELPKPVTKTAGGIALPDSVVQEREALVAVGKIVDVGPLAFSAKTRGDIDFSVHREQVRVGSWVLLAKYAGQQFDREGRRYTILNDNELLGLIDEKDVESFLNVV